MIYGIYIKLRVSRVQYLFFLPLSHSSHSTFVILLEIILGK